VWFGVAAMAAGIALSGSARAADYYFASVSEAGWFFVDLEKVETVTPNIKSAWALTIYNKSEERGSAYLRVQAWFDCEKKVFIPLKFYDYRLDGKVRDYGKYSIKRVQVQPGTVLESQLDFVCATNPDPRARLGDVEPLALTKRLRAKAAEEKAAGPDPAPAR
jgi:hypothetical protein